VNNNLKAEQLVNEEFVEGIKPGSRARYDNESEMLENIKQTMKDVYQWNEHSKFSWMAAQTCPDMLVNVGKTSSTLHTHMVVNVGKTSSNLHRHSC
jgi:hypothetical protein